MIETKGPFEPRVCPDLPTECCDFGVVSLSEGVEICRVWKEADARNISDLLNSAADRIEALEAENARLRAELPGDMFWDAGDPGEPLECWNDPIAENWNGPDDYYPVLTAKKLPTIYVTGEVVSIDDNSDPDEVKPVWFATRKEAEGHFQRSLEIARAALAHSPEGGE